MRRDSQRVKSLSSCGRAKQWECALPPPKKKTPTTGFLFLLSEALWSFLLTPPWDDIPVWINGFMRGVTELKRLQMLDSGEHPADTGTPTQLHLKWLPIMPGCCDSSPVYVLLSLLSFISKAQCLVYEMSRAQRGCASGPLLLQYLKIWNKGWNLNRRHKFCHCSSFWLLSAHFFPHCRLSLSCCPET